MSISEQTTSSLQKSGGGTKRFIGACLLGGLLLFVAFLRFVPLPHLDPFGVQRKLNEERFKVEQAEKRRAEEERQRRLKAAETEITGMIEGAHAQMFDTIKIGRGKAANVLTKQKTQIPELTAKVDEKLQGHGNALKLVKFMAKDKVTGTHETQHYLQEAFQPVVSSFAHVEGDLQQVLKECDDSLNLQAANLQAGIAQVLDTEGFKAADLGLEGSLQSLSADSVDQVMKASIRFAIATVEVAIEALLIKTTYETVSKLLAKAVAKEVGSLSIGAGGAAIPVVDIFTTVIAVGGTAWTLYDVYSAVEELKKVDPVIRAGLVDSVAKMEKKSDEAFCGLEKAVAGLCK